MKDLHKTEISKKADEIFKTIKIITDLIPDDNEILKEIKSHIMENIMVLQAKLYSAERMKLWDLKMENAAIIRKNARELMVQYHSLKMFGFEDVRFEDPPRRTSFDNLIKTLFISSAPNP